MTLLAKSVAFQKRTSTGTQAITGLGFTPKAILFHTIFRSSEDAWGNQSQYCIGFSDGTTDRCNNIYSLTAQATSAAEVSYSSHAIELFDNSATLLVRADVQSFDSDGFTLNWTTNSSSANWIYALCLGGTDITNTKVGSFGSRTTNGSQSVTGLGFQPDFLFFMKFDSTSLDIHSSGSSLNLGFAKSSTKRGAVSISARNGQTTSITRRYLRTDKCLANIDKFSNTGAIITEADFTSMDTDGFTLNVTNSPSTADLIAYMALKGGNYDVGTITIPTTNSTQAITGVGFQPAAVLMASVNSASMTSSQTTAALSIGSGDSTTSRHASFTNDVNGVGTTVAQVYCTSTQILFLGDASGPTTKLVGDLSAVGTDGFSLTYASNDGTANRQALYVAFGNVAAPPPPPPPVSFYLKSALFVSDK